MKTCTLKLQFPPELSGLIPYPSKACVLELKSRTMPDKLTALLAKRIRNHIDEHVKNRQAYLLSAYKFIANIIECNNLIPCWAEFADIKQVIKADKGDLLKTFEKAGKLRVTLKEQTQYVILEFTVPEEYPQKMAKLLLIETNFSEDMAFNFLNQAREIMLNQAEGGSKK